MRRRVLPAALALALVALPRAAAPQESGVKFAIGDLGLGIGDVRRLDGIRLNFRDRDLERVRGLNATLWTPYQGADGVVEGIALGLPLTGAGEIRGLAVGAGVAVEHSFTGLGLAPLGMGAGGGMKGIALAGIGLGGGGDMEGIFAGGVGLGTGGSVRGVAVGGVGLGVGGSLSGIALGGVGLGVGGDATGLMVGGVGVGASGDVRGVTLAGVGLGAGGSIEGITIAGVGVGSGTEIRGLTVAGVGVGAPRLIGVVLTGIGAGAEEARGLVVAPAYFKIEEGGELRGLSVSAWNNIRGSQRGLAIGLLNIAEELHGVQVGLINIARNKRSFSVLPFLNYHP